jgi:6-hydroxytryprostatin B O-methyltransferase
MQTRSGLGLWTCQTAFNVAFKTDLPFFKYIGEEPERQRQFAGFMRALTSGQEAHFNHLVKGWDWNRLGRALVVDVSNLSLRCIYHLQ